MASIHQVNAPRTSRTTAPGTGGKWHVVRLHLAQHAAVLRPARHICSAAALEASTPAASPAVQQQQQHSTGDVIATLPEPLRRNLAVLSVDNANARDGETRVYVLGMSHVSAASCDQIEQLIEATRPDIVLLELCKDRLGLLATDPPLGRQLWHTRKIQFVGLPAEENYPNADALRALLCCKPGRPFGEAEIREDCRTLLSTGLFRSVRPRVFPPTVEDAPLLLLQSDESGGDRVATVPPLNSLEFTLQERILPPITEFKVRIDSSVDAASRDAIDNDAVARITSDAVAPPSDAAADASTSSNLRRYLSLRAQLRQAAAACTCEVDVAFKGVETGKVEAVLRAAHAHGHGTILTGLEDSAQGGEGWGIDPVKLDRGPVKVGTKMSLPAEAVERIAARRDVQLSAAALQNASAASTSGAWPPPQANDSSLPSQCRTAWRPWSSQEIATPADELPSQGFIDAFGEWLTREYAARQANAGDVVGIDQGSAWVSALHAAMRSSTSQVLLGDRPADVSEKRLAQSLFRAMSGRIAGAAAVPVLALAAVLSHVAPQGTDAAVLGASLAAAAALLWPIYAPLLEVERLANMDAEEIENAVLPKEPLQQNIDQPLFLDGEDALVNWPGALQPIITERDDFMAKSTFAAATGQSGIAPAFVAEEVQGRTIMRYMMADGAPSGTCPTGRGDGCYTPLKDANVVVAIVGTAHVRGMCQRWRDLLSSKDCSITDLLNLQ